jgi:uncharacterized membrane protein YhaH (DUF805 family)
VSGPIQWRELLASPAGRAPRSQFWIGAGALFVVSAVYEAVSGPAAKLLTFWFVYPALLASAACVTSKRLHDRGRSGWWAALVLGALIMVWPGTEPARALLAAPVLIWAAVELILLPGEDGANRYGDSPLADALA